MGIAGVDFRNAARSMEHGDKNSSRNDCSLQGEI
jgi:hypothetical protein